MRESLRDKGRLLHIQNAIDTILERAERMSYDDLIADKILFGGIVYYTMIIGEASYKLSRAFKENFTEIDWEVIANMRHHLVHGYYQVNALDVWNVIQQDLLPLPSKEGQGGSKGAVSWEEQKAQARQRKKLEKAVSEAEQAVAELEQAIAILEAQMATGKGGSEISLYEKHGRLKQQLSKAEEEWTEAMEALDSITPNN